MSTQTESNNTEPKLYTYQGKKYLVDDLKNTLDKGIGEYIQSLRRGDKDREEFWDAYSNIVSGLGDGTITFDSGRLVDSLGRYSNGIYYDSEGNKQQSKRKNRDYYGLITNYVINNLGSSEEYQDPKEKQKIKWNGTNSLGLAFNHRMFNADQGNLQDFLDLDPYDKNSNSRPVTNRLTQTKQAVQYLYDNFDSLFSGYTEDEKQNALSNLEGVLNSLSNGMDSTDYLPLSKAFGDIGWRDMFSTTSKEKSNEEQPKRELSESELQSAFSNLIAQNYGRKQGDTGELSCQYSDNLATWTASRYLTMLNNASDKELYGYLTTAINNPSFNFGTLSSFQQALGQKNYGVNVSSAWVARRALQILKNRNKLAQDPSDPGIFYLTDNVIDKSTNSSLVYDSNSKTLFKKNIQDIPYLLNRMYDKFKENPDQYFTSYQKNGGILKAQTGVKLGENADYYTGVFLPQLDHILQGLDKDQDYYGWLNDMQDKHSEIHSQAGDNFYNNAYKNDLVGAYQNEYKQGFKNEWEGNQAGYNSLGIQNAQKNGMFDIFGNTKRISGDWGNKNWKTDNLFSAITDYRRLLGRKGDYTDEQLKQIQDKFKEHGYDFILGANDYYKLSPIAKSVQEPVTQDNTPQDQGKNPAGNPSNLFPTTPGQPLNKWKRLGNFMYELTPDLLTTGRLFYSLRTNNKVAKTLRESLNPVLRDTYERYSPITGAFGEMQMMNGQAADLRRQASTPFTSDASLQLAGQLEANKQARSLEQQGFLADNKAIEASRQAALERQEDNMKRRSDVANFNRASINQTNRERAELEATRLRRNWQSTDNYLQGVESRLRTAIENRKNLRQSLAQYQLQDRYSRGVQGLNSDFKKKYPNASYSDMLNNEKYTSGIKNMQNWLKYNSLESALHPYKYTYSGNTFKSPEEIVSSTRFKNGGILTTKTINLINKIIRDENNS